MNEKKCKQLHDILEGACRVLLTPVNGMLIFNPIARAIFGLGIKLSEAGLLPKDDKTYSDATIDSFIKSMEGLDDAPAGATSFTYKPPDVAGNWTVVNSKGKTICKCESQENAILVTQALEAFKG